MARQDGPEPLSPRTVQLLYRLAGALGVIAGVAAIIAFWLGLAREGQVRWALLVIGCILLTTPLALRLLLPPP